MVIDNVEHGVNVSKSSVKCHIIIHDNTTPAAAKPMQRAGIGNCTSEAPGHRLSLASSNDMIQMHLPALVSTSAVLVTNAL